MFLFRRKNTEKEYDKENTKPVIKASICTGEKVAGFQNIHTGQFEDIMLIKTEEDLKNFKTTYGIEGPIDKIY